MSDEPILTGAQLYAYADALDVAELAATGSPFIALGRLATMLQTNPAVAMNVLVAFMAASIRMMADISGVTVEEMATQLRASGAK